jgi:predicted outer membrane repeat protein
MVPHNWPHRRAVARGRFVVGSLSASLLLASALSVGAPVQPASAVVRVLYAYAHGGAASPTTCPSTSDASQQCTLAQALVRAAAGNVIALATPGGRGHYVGNWVISTAGTTSSAPLTVRPAAGVAAPTLDGNNGQGAGCGTQACNGPILTVSGKVHLDLDGLTIQDANNTARGLGGAIENIHGGTVSVSHSAFFHDYANANGGAIDNAGTTGTGTLVVVGSSFSSNSAVNGDGGAIANGDVGGQGTVAVTGSTFSSNSAINGNGGAIDSGDTRGRGTLTLSASTFVGNVAGRAGAVDNADNGSGTLVVSRCTFSDNVAALDDAGAIDNADWSGQGTLSVSGSTFTSNKTVGDGGAIDNADNTGSVGRAVVSTSTFWGNIADVHGGAIDSSDVGSEGTVSLWASTFSRNTANNVYSGAGIPGGGAVYLGKHGMLWAAADIFNGPCRSLDGIWYDKGYNVGRDGSCLRRGTDDVSDGSLRLGPLSNNGGPTKTAVPAGGNPAISAIPFRTSVRLGGRTVSLCPAPDQRGASDNGKHRCDAGSVQ